MEARHVVASRACERWTGTCGGSAPRPPTCPMRVAVPGPMAVARRLRQSARARPHRRPLRLGRDERPGTAASSMASLENPRLSGHPFYEPGIIKREYCIADSFMTNGSAAHASSTPSSSARASPRSAITWISACSASTPGTSTTRPAGPCADAPRAGARLRRARDRLVHRSACRGPSRRLRFLRARAELEPDLLQHRREAPRIRANAARMRASASSCTASGRNTSKAGRNSAPARMPSASPPASPTTCATSCPSRGLVFGEWRKHGTCTGLSPEGYFALTREACETRDDSRRARRARPRPDGRRARRRAGLRRGQSRA